MADSIPNILSRVPSYAYLPIAFAVICYVLRGPLLRLITPKGLQGMPAYPDPQPILGDVWRLKECIEKYNSFSRYFDQQVRDLGPISQIRMPFNQTFICLADYAETEYLLTRSTQVDRSWDTIAVFSTILPKAMLSLPTKAMWKHHRRIIGPAMTSKYLSLTTPRANAAAQSLIRLWKAKVAKAGERTFAAEHDMESATMDAICGMAFGDSWHIVDHCTTEVNALQRHEVQLGDLGNAVFHTTKPPMAESTWKIFESLPMMSSFPAISHFISRLTPSYRFHSGRLRDYLNEKLRASREKAKFMGFEAANEHADNTLDLMTAKELRGDDTMPDDEMRDEVFQYLLAGTETSGVTLSWWVKYMTNHPEVQHKLRRHILDSFPEWEDEGRTPAFEDLNATKLPYLEAVVYEALRLSRTAGGFTRQALEDMTILGHFVPKKTVIIMSTMLQVEDASTPIYKPPASFLSKDSGLPTPPDTPGAHEKAGASSSKAIDVAALNEHLAPLRSEGASRKCGYWAAGTALKYDPERWIDADGKFDPNAGPFIPFSMGQRGCFGRNLAMLEMRLFMTHLNLSFFFAPIPETQNGFDKFETVATHPTQCYVRPVSWDDPLAQQ